MHVPKNAKNIHKWTIVSSVLKHVEDVLKNAVRWPGDSPSQKYEIRTSTFFLVIGFGLMYRLYSIVLL